GRRVLPFGQTVNLVVEENDFHVDVATDRVQEVISADRQSIAVTGDDPDLQLGTAELHAGGDRGSSAVNAMQAIRVQVVREPARTADTRYKAEFFFRNPKRRQHL